jgi:fibronectin-binding autotransporter adhesin
MRNLLKIALASAICGFISIPTVRAQTTYWSDVSCTGTYAWTAACWNTTGAGNAGSGAAPTSGAVSLLNANSVAANITIGYSTASTSLGILTIDVSDSGNSLTFNQSAGSISSTQEIVGNGGGGQSIYTQTSGTNSVATAAGLTIGNGDQSNGTYNLSGASTTLTAGNETLGSSGFATFNQNGGTHTISNALYIAVNSSSTGIFALNAGSLSVGGGGIQGGSGYSELDISGGTLSVAGNITLSTFNLGNNASTTSGYTLGGTQVLTITNTMAVGASGAGTLTQTGGTNTANYLVLGENGTGNGTYNLKSGTLAGTGGEVVGYQGTGVFNQSGGSNSTAGSTLSVGGDGGTGTYNLSGSGSLSSPDELIGYPGSGTFAQTGGTNTTSELFLGSGGDSATYTLSGGTLTVNGPITAGSNGTFNLNGGTLAVSGGIQVNALNIGAAAAYTNAAGKQITASQLSNSGTLVNQGTLSLSGTLGNSGTLQLAGGTLSGSGTWSNTNGSLSGYGTVSGTATFSNYGLVTQNAGTLTFSNTGTNYNYGNWNLLAGYQLQLSGSTLINTGTVNLDSGYVAGTGTLNNALGGTITGPGAISTTFANGGVLALSGGTTSVSNAFTNSGQIQLSASSASLNGATITNTGLIAGTGTVANAINNTSGTIQAVSGTLGLTGALSNSGTGVISALTGARLLVSSGVATNAGTIQLAGGTYDNGGQIMSNSGTISGYGTLNSGVLTNSGQINLSGAPATINSPITGLSGSSTTVGSSIATFNGTVAMQSGASLRVASTAVATFFGTVDENTGSIFSGTGTSNYEGTLNIGGSGSVADVPPVVTPAATRVWTSAATSPASTLLAPGVVANAGNVIFGSTNTFVAAIGGTTAGSYDQYQVGGSLTYGGTLQLDWYGNFTGAAGESFRLFQAVSESGQFSSVDTSGAPLAAGLEWDTSQLASQGVLSIEASPVPLPPALAMMVGGLGLLGFAARRRRPCRLAA